MVATVAMAQSCTLNGRRALGPDLEEPKKLCFFTVDFSTGQQQAATKAGGAGNAAKCDVAHCDEKFESVQKEMLL